MPILYVFNVVNPSLVTPFPPTVEKSKWFEDLVKYHSIHAIAGVTDSGSALLLFSNQDEVNNYLDQYRLTDANLIADINLWKQTHKITYSSYFYTLTDANITSMPIIP